VRFDLLLCYAVVDVDINQLLFNAIDIENLIPKTVLSALVSYNCNVGKINIKNKLFRIKYYKSSFINFYEILYFSNEIC
jgi:hypothetical protein